MDARIGELFSAHSAMVLRVCVRYVGDRAQAEDLLQEIFLKVDRSLAGFEGGSAMGTWIYRIAVNACLDHLRGRRRRHEVPLQDLDALVVHNAVSGGDRELARIDLERILGEAQPEMREFLFLTRLEGLTYQEASMVTGRSAEAIAQAVSRFLRHSTILGRIRGTLKARRMAGRRKE